METEARYKATGHNIVIDPERVFPTSIPGAAMPAQSARADAPDPSENNSDSADFSAEEHFTYCENSLEEILTHLRAAA